MMKNFFKNSKIIKAFYGIFGTLPLLLTLYLYPFIPDKIPTHYWLDGSIDKWGNKGELLFSYYANQKFLELILIMNLKII